MQPFLSLYGVKTEIDAASKGSLQGFKSAPAGNFVRGALFLIIINLDGILTGAQI